MMNYRRRTLAILLSSATVTTLALTRYISQKNPSDEHSNNDTSLKLLEKKLHLTDDLLRNKNDIPYIDIETIDSVTTMRYQQALHYVKQTHSDNVHIRERGLSHLARLDHLPATYYAILGQQLDYHSAIQLARTSQANSNYFPTGPPYIFSVGKQKILATDKIEKVNDDDVLLYTIREFLEKLIDDQKRPLDILSDHYLKLLQSYLNEVDSKTVFDVGQHFEPEHADMSDKAIKRYRSNLELYSTFLYALRGYADRYPLEVIHYNGLQILKYLYEKRQSNVPFVRFIGKILLLLSRDQRTHDAFYAVGWVRILHEMALDKDRIVYCLLASTILANLDRPIPRKKTSISEGKITLPLIEPLQLSSEITPIEIIEAEQKIEEKKEAVLETKLTEKTSTPFQNLVGLIWNKRPISDEGDLTDQIETNTITDDQTEKKLAAPDIDTSHAVNGSKTPNIEQEQNVLNSAWSHDQVYGDKIVLFSPTLYNIRQIDPDARWHQEPSVDVIFFHGLAGSAFKTWRQESIHTESKAPTALPTAPVEGSSSAVTDELSEDENDEVLDLAEETKWSAGNDSQVAPAAASNVNHGTPCWPKDWLSEDVPTSHIRMLAVDYESRVSEWQVQSLPKNVLRRSMHDRAQEIAEQLKQAGVGKRPIIWVAHSMGGLLTKYILTNEENDSLRANTRACVFFSVPHFGAELASFGIRHAFIVRPTVEIEELQPKSENLLALHERFLDVLKIHDNIRILSFAENEKTTFSLRYETVVVPSESSQINIGKFFILNKNHIFICKPNSKHCLEYQELRDLIQTIYDERRNELKTEEVRATEEFLNNLFTFSSPTEDDMQ